MVPLFSIITPVHNAAATLDSTIQSVKAQTESSWEHLLIDDGSIDASRDVVSRAAKVDSRVRPISLHQNTGAAKARNTGIASAKGRYIAFLDADDLWLPNKLRCQRLVLESGADFVFSSYRRIDAAGNYIGSVLAPSLLDYRLALRGNAVGCLTAVYDTKVHGRVFMPEIARRQDYGLWLKLLRNGGTAVGIKEHLALYRVRPGSLSSNKVRAAKDTWHLLRRCEGLKTLEASYYFSHYAIQAARKRLRANSLNQQKQPY